MTGRNGRCPSFNTCAANAEGTWPVSGVDTADIADIAGVTVVIAVGIVAGAVGAEPIEIGMLSGFDGMFPAATSVNGIGGCGRVIASLTGAETDPGPETDTDAAVEVGAEADAEVGTAVLTGRVIAEVAVGERLPIKASHSAQVVSRCAANSSAPGKSSPLASSR